MPTSLLRRAVVPVSAAVLLLGALSGCGKDDPKEPAAETPMTAGPSTPATSDASTPTPETSAPTTSASSATPSTPASTLVGQLLSAGQFPGLNEATRWKETGTAAIGGKGFGICQKFDLITIGATEAIQRTFTTTDKDPAISGEQIAVFPDAKQAQRAGSVLRAWQRDCASEIVGVTNLDIDAIQNVGVSKGTGAWYLISFVPAGSMDDGRFVATGFVVSGNKIALLRLENNGQDYNYELGQEPMAKAVKLAAGKLT